MLSGLDSVKTQTPEKEYKYLLGGDLPHLVIPLYKLVAEF